MTMAPVVAPPEAQPKATQSPAARSETERLSRPFRLGITGIGIALGLFTRLAAANGYGDLDSRPTMLAAALTSALVGVGLLMIASERDRFGPPLAWMSAVTAMAWAALNWISPPFAASVTVWSKPDQAILSVLGIGNGLLLAGLIALAFVRRAPTLSVASTMLAGVFALAANTVVLRDEWPAIVLLGAAFALILLAWDRSPRHERSFTVPDKAPRVSRAALSFISVALCGTALQVWLSRMSAPRSIPAVVVAVLLIGAAFASLIRVRREIEQRDTTLSEWTSWMREIRTNDFRAEMQNFESTPSSAPTSEIGAIGLIEAPPRKLSFPDLMVPDGPTEDDDALLAFERDIASIGAAELAQAAGELAASTPSPRSPAMSPSGLVADAAPAEPLETAVGLVPDTVAPQSTTPARATGLPRIDTAPASVTSPAADRVSGGEPVEAPTVDASQEPATSTAFSTVLATSADADQAAAQVTDLNALAAWLASPAAAARVRPLLLAVEAMTLAEFDTLPPADAAMATDEIGSFLADAMPEADLVSWIDGPYFVIAFASKPDADLAALNKAVRKSLKPTNGTLALLRPGPDAVLDDLVNEAVLGLLTARRLEDRAAGR